MNIQIFKVFTGITLIFLNRIEVKYGFYCVVFFSS